MSVFTKDNRQNSIQERPPRIDSYGWQRWFVDGMLHRTHGPAVITATGKESWYINNEAVRSFKELQSLTNLSNEDLLALQLKYGDIA